MRPTRAIKFGLVSCTATPVMLPLPLIVLVKMWGKNFIMPTTGGSVRDLWSQPPMSATQERRTLGPEGGESRLPMATVSSWPAHRDFHVTLGSAHTSLVS